METAIVPAVKSGAFCKFSGNLRAMAIATAGLLTPAESAVTVCGPGQGMLRDYGIGPAGQAQQLSEIPGQSYLTVGSGNIDCFHSAFTAYLSAAVVGPYGGNLSISGCFMLAATSSLEYWNRADARFMYSINGSAAVDLAHLENIQTLGGNYSSDTVYLGQEFNSGKIYLSPGQDYTITGIHLIESDNMTVVTKAGGNSDFTQGVSFTYTKNFVPEPSTGLLVGAAAMALIRRRRAPKAAAA